ncbi:MAG: Rieske 2Fe-2S domain-containing protein [Pseudomonadales bacterium]|nr:Rieske 2Fe-2S domain-containing protein [Pseudomonadales bacterium]MBH2076163.1 Rieske 2Fe-2S domain-containing protein [Pseudomonadales bacterium]
MLKNLWYVVLPSSQLTDDLTAIRIVGQSFVAFRDEHGKACLLSDVCVHRGGSLSADEAAQNPAEYVGFLILKRECFY